ncbi:MAG: BPL-N domain-containing protein, partial [Planctomycetota bacterium]
MRIRLYNDAGADAFCVKRLADALRDTSATVTMIDAAGILASDWQNDCDVIAFPGGADRPYMDKLNGRGNDLIRDFVESGGKYLGVCAGAYYACRRIDFTGVDLRVQAPRELDFFPGTAVGSLTQLAASYEIGNLACAAATPVDGVNMLYWGGCVFRPDDDARFDALARFDAMPTGDNIAAVRTRVGHGVPVSTATP